MRRIHVFIAGAVCAGLLIGACSAEAALRLYVAIDRSAGARLVGYDPMAVEIEPEGRLGYRQRPNSVFHYGNGVTASSNALGYRGPEVRPTPPPGTIRIVLLGESTTHGYGVPDDQTIDANMRRLLSRRYPQRRFEVVNLAFDGYDSYQELERFRKQGIPLHPTVVVVNTGINDVRNAWYADLQDPDPRTLIWGPVVARLRAERARGGPSLWTLTKHYLLVARLPGYLREQLRSRAEARDKSALLALAGIETHGAGPASAARPGPPYPDAALLFDRHIRQLVDLALTQGMSVLLSTPPSALRSYPPSATSPQGYWIRDAKTTQDYRDELAHRLRAIAEEEASRGRPVRYIAPAMPRPFFLDDCHLTGAGNAVMAEAFVDVVTSLLGIQTAR